jgi:DNA polymerase-3 subunit epsilon
VIWPFARALPLLDEESHARRERIATGTPNLKAPLGATRWCVVDVETGGLDAAHDPLLSIGAVEVAGQTIVIERAFEIGLAQTHATDASNILIHGISGSEQRNGKPTHTALLAWLEFAQDAPRVAFHAAFDQTVLRRAVHQQLGLQPAAPWFDAAVLAPLLFPDAAARCRELDDWLTHFGITAFARHGALADAYATAELWLVLLAAAQREGITNPHQLQKLARARRWLGAH